MHVQILHVYLTEIMVYTNTYHAWVCMYVHECIGVCVVSMGVYVVCMCECAVHILCKNV